MTRLYDYQTWQTFFEKFTRSAKVCGLFSLCFRDSDWLGRKKSARMDITLPGVKKKVVGAIEGDFWSNNSNNSKKNLTGLTRSLPSS